MAGYLTCAHECKSTSLKAALVARNRYRALFRNYRSLKAASVAGNFKGLQLQQYDNLKAARVAGNVLLIRRCPASDLKATVQRDTRALTTTWGLLF